MTPAKSKHVEPSISGGWAIRDAGAIRASKLFATQAEAIQYARSFAEDSPTVLYIHTRDGSVLSKSTLGGARARLRSKPSAARDKLNRSAVKIAA